MEEKGNRKIGKNWKEKGNRKEEIWVIRKIGDRLLEIGERRGTRKITCTGKSPCN